MKSSCVSIQRIILRSAPFFIGGLCLFFSLLLRVEGAEEVEGAGRGDASFVITILKSADIAPYNTAVNSFKKEMDVKAADFRYEEHVLQREGEGRGFSERMDELTSDLLLTVGTPASRFAKTHVKEIPVIFAMVHSPVKNGLVDSYQNPGSNMTGVCLDVPLEVQMQTLLNLIPKAQKIGVVYDQNNTSEVVQELDRVLSRINVELVAAPVKSSNDIPDAFKSLIGRVDAFWAPMDKSVYNPKSSEFILFFTLRNKTPIFAFSDNYVMAGALAANMADFSQQGRTAADIAEKILIGGEKATKIPVVQADEPLLFLNERVARLMNLDIPESAKKKVDRTFR